MNGVLKFQDSFDVKNFVMSDLHWNHDPKWAVPIWKVRGFDSVTESNEYAIQSINDMVKKDDRLFNLGDLCLNCSEDDFERLISAINCQNVYVIFGNHPNPMWKIYKREVKLALDELENRDGFNSFSGQEVEIYPFRYKNLIFLGNYAEVIVNGKYFVLGHYPIHSWNHQKTGSIHLYGHLHCENSPVGGKRFDVGWDKNLRPYSFDEIIKMMESIPILGDGGHH